MFCPCIEAHEYLKKEVVVDKLFFINQNKILGYRLKNQALLWEKTLSFQLPVEHIIV